MATEFVTRRGCIRASVSAVRTNVRIIQSFLDYQIVSMVQFDEILLHLASPKTIARFTAMPNPNNVTASVQKPDLLVNYDECIHGRTEIIGPLS